MIDLTRREEHFDFGSNWAQFAESIDVAQISHAERCLRNLIGDSLSGQSFLDIGCGSGLSALAAISLGAARVRAVDLDIKSVATTQSFLKLHAARANWSASLRSVLELDPATDGAYDVVYSWGALHHTGAMWDAIRKAAALVKEHGRFVLAIYQRTPCCGFWRWEKKMYSRSPTWMAAAIRTTYKAAFLGAYLTTGRNPFRYSAEYGRNRGMRWSNDVHDWLGGYPYESATADEIDVTMKSLGFQREKIVLCNVRAGIFGSACNEFVYRRI
jgi:SAM-dependent methyltransferase